MNSVMNKTYFAEKRYKDKHHNKQLQKKQKRQQFYKRKSNMK